MPVRSERRFPSSRERGVLRIQVRVFSGQFSEWETLGSLTAMARESGYEVEVDWVCDDPCEGGPGLAISGSR